MDKDLEEKAHLLLTAQRAYIDTIRYGNPAWASAAGFQVGSLYEELYDSFMHAPVPPELDRDAQKVYGEELQRKVRILLEKSLRWQRENLLMIERLGVNTDWAERSKVAYAKILRLLDPNLPAPEPRQEDDGHSNPPTQAPANPGAPPMPSLPERRGETTPDKEPSDVDALRRHVL
jgi:hypothetical protein